MENKDDKIHIYWDEGIEDYSAKVYFKIVDGIYEIKKIVLEKPNNGK